MTRIGNVLFFISVSDCLTQRLRYLFAYRTIHAIITCCILAEL